MAQPGSKYIPHRCVLKQPDATLLSAEEKSGYKYMYGLTAQHTPTQLHYTHCLLFNQTNPHGEKLRCNSQTLSCEWIHWAGPEGVKKLVPTSTDCMNHMKPIKMFQAHWKLHQVFFFK